ncbi:MAG: 3'-5' exonuclease [Treponema sp.]
MEHSYLFFDIECANCFGGVGKMCSFGYVLTDADFTVLDSQDVAMNPEAEFDWYLFSAKNKCKLAYSKDYFRAQRNFAAYYKGIKKLLEESGRRVIGFSSANDVGFVVSAWERYGLEPINFAAYDSAAIASSITGEKRGLSDWCAFFNVDTSNLTAHCSRDDAMMTMLLVKALCAQNNEGLESLLARHKDSRLSVEKYLERREIKRRREETIKKIEALYGKKSRALLSDKFAGRTFALSRKLMKNADDAYALADYIFHNGGVLNKSVKAGGGVLIVPDGDERNATESGIKTMTADAVRGGE